MWNPLPRWVQCPVFLQVLSPTQLPLEAPFPFPQKVWHSRTPTFAGLGTFSTPSTWLNVRLKSSTRCDNTQDIFNTLDCPPQVVNSLRQCQTASTTFNL